MGRINFKDENVGRGKNLMVENGQKKKKNTWEREPCKRQKLLKLQNKNVKNNFFLLAWMRKRRCGEMVRKYMGKWETCA